MRRVTYQGIVCPYSLLTALDSRVCDEMEREREMKIEAEVEVELETVSYTDRKDNGVSTTAY
jgi:hypothetical protein